MSRAPIAFARRLTELRDAAGLTPAALARKAGVNRQTLAELESGEREPTWETVRRLAHALDVTVAAFDGEGTPNEVNPQRLLDAARHYARAYDQLEQKSRTADGGSPEWFARFQEAQVELNLAALDLFAAQNFPRRQRPGSRTR